MNDVQSAPNSQHLYRIDKFKVPPQARDEFLTRVHEIDGFLKTLPGYVRHTVYEQSSGPGAFNFVTLAEWESASHVEGALQSVAARNRANGFNQREVLARLGIEADIAFYVRTS
ncbi:MAG: antibiotic biosynthesis monooxygenase [Acidobacteria bacterium]|nr:antibiotic biosynthesis monooxygenase [Acidobacteriota bacterium]